MAPNISTTRWSKEFREAGKKRLLGDTTRETTREATSTDVQDLRRETVTSSRSWPIRSLRIAYSKQSAGLRLGGRYLGLTAAEKHEIIRLVEGSDLSVRRTLRGLGVHRSTFHAWYRRYQVAAGLVPRPSAARRHWNRIPPRVRHRLVEVALADPAQSPRDLAWQFRDQERHFLSESSVYRILTAESLQNVTPADVYHGRRPAILAGREQIKLRTLQARRRENLRPPHNVAQRRNVSLTTGPQWTGLVGRRTLAEFYIQAGHSNRDH